MFGMGVQTMQFAMTLCFEFAIAVLGGNYHFKSELINNQKASRGQKFDTPPVKLKEKS